MAFESFFKSAATIVGAITLTKLVYNASFILWLYFLRPSQLHKYRDANLSSWALVTGSSDGIGLELARELLAQGFNVLIHGRNETKLEGVKKSLLEQHPERSVDIVVADAADPDLDYNAIVKKANSVSGPLTVLINCVGGITTNPIYLPLEELHGHRH
jgi:17beta-estradiol 17-dehydrogenase / very-long-chain 3-oxoacyl-CoA reductase